MTFGFDTLYFVAISFFSGNTRYEKGRLKKIMTHSSPPVQPTLTEYPARGSEPPPQLDSEPSN